MLDEDRLNDLLDRWEDLAEAGERIDPVDLCRDVPELLPELSRRIQILTSMNVLLSIDDLSSVSDGATKVRGQDSTAEMKLAISRIRAGRYVPISFLAEGGLGRLFVARDTELNRDVVLKLIKNETIADAETRRRFEFEAEITSRLDHPGIVPVYGFGREERSDGRAFPYYAMRLIRGRRLEDAIREFHATQFPNGEYNLELQKLLRSFLTVCETIAYAHSRGIIHRDLKPANIMLGEYGETLVVDWGLAKVVSNPDMSDDGTDHQLMPASIKTLEQTQIGYLKGTLAYMSPEQARGDWRIVSCSSDIYSLGAILYTLLTGKKAFPDREEHRVLQNVISGRFAPPRGLASQIPPALEHICLKAMNHNPIHRYHTVTALAQDIEHWLADEPVSAWREPWRYRLQRWCKRHSTMLISTAAALTVAVVGLGLATTLLQETNQQLQIANELAERHFLQANSAVREIVDQACGNPLLRKPGMHRAQESLLKVALAYYQDFIQQRSNDPRLQSEMLDARLAMAAIVHDLKSPLEARDVYQSVGAFLEARLHGRTNQRALREQLALVNSRLAQIDCELGLIDANRDHFFKADSAYQEMLHESPDDLRLRLAYANALFLQGEETNNPQLLEKARQQIESSASNSFSLTGDAALLLARVFSQISLHEMQSAHLKEAADSLARATELVAKFHSLATESDAPEIEAISHSIALNQGRLAKLQGDSAKAVNQLESARKGFESLVHRDPEIGEYHSRLATAHLELGKVSLAMGRVERAQQELSAARGELNAQPHTTLRILDRFELARSALELGEVSLKMGDFDQARELFKQSQREFDSLVAVDPSKPDYHRNLAATWNQIASLEQRRGDLDACGAALHKAKTELEPIAAAHPDRSEFRNALAKVYFNLGMLRSSQSDWDEAWRWLKQAREIYDAQVADHPDISDFQTDRIQYLQRFVALCRSRQISLVNSPEDLKRQRFLLQETLEALEALKQSSALSNSLQELAETVRNELNSIPPVSD